MSLYSPQEIISRAGALAIEKDSYSVGKIMTLSFLAGAYISFGGILAIMIGGGMPGVAAANPGIIRFVFGAVFPIGLMMVVMAGAELFTGNNAFFMPNVLSGKQSWKAPLRNWSLVYIGNFIGTICVAYFLVHLAGIVAEDPWRGVVVNISEAKVTSSFFVIFLKGIGANWLVCLALWMAMSAQHTTGKILGIWWPIMAFVAIGFEHSIANMFFISLGMFTGANVSVFSFFFDNILPATLGNIVGGSFFVGTVYWYAYIKK